MDEDIVLLHRLKISPVAAVDSVNTRQLKQKPHSQRMHTEIEQLYKSLASNSATSKSNWFQIAFTEGSFQVHGQIGLVHTHPLLGSCRRSCSGANVVLTERVTLDKSIRWLAKSKMWLFPRTFSQLEFSRQMQKGLQNWDNCLLPVIHTFLSRVFNDNSNTRRESYIRVKRVLQPICSTAGL